jgi:hypothetical protein
VGEQRSSRDAGLSGLGLVLGMAGLLMVLLIGGIVVAATLSPNSNTTSSTTSNTTSTTALGATTTASTAAPGLASAPPAAQVAACRVDASALLAALAAYDATRGTNPDPPTPWSALTYQGDYGPLTQAVSPGPFLKAAPSTLHYVLEYDVAGHVWVESPGQYDASYVAANDASNGGACARVAR